MYIYIYIYMCAHNDLIHNHLGAPARVSRKQRGKCRINIYIHIYSHTHIYICVCTQRLDTQSPGCSSAYVEQAAAPACSQSWWLCPHSQKSEEKKIHTFVYVSKKHILTSQPNNTSKVSKWKRKVAGKVLLARGCCGCNKWLLTIMDRCCRVLQCIVVCCSVLQCVVMCCCCGCNKKLLTIMDRCCSVL